MDPVTMRQVAELKMTPARPVIICDVDEVTLHFVRGFEQWLEEHELWLDPRSYHFEGNVRRRDDGEVIPTHQLKAHMQAFFKARIGSLEAIEGAAEVLAGLSSEAQVVMLTNLPHEYHETRRRNLAGHGMDYPLITNSGPKGPAVAAIAGRGNGDCVFVDDHADFLESAHEHHPRAELVHFLHDERFAPHARQVPQARARVGHWQAAEAVIRQALDGEGR